MVVMVFGMGHCGGCGFFFFFGCDRCLKGLWVVVGSDVWVVSRGWVQCLGCSWVVAEVGCWLWIGEASHSLSLISHRGSTSWVLIGGLGSVDGGFETVDLLIGGWIGWVDHR